MQFSARVVRRDYKDSRSAYVTLPPVFTEGWNVQNGDILTLDVLEIKKALSEMPPVAKKK